MLVEAAWNNRFTALGHEAVGLDGSGELCAMARANTDCVVLHQDFLALDLPSDRFDGIFANASLFHVPSSQLHLVGGRMQQKAQAYPEIEMGPPEVVEKRISQYREEGFRHFQVKAGRGSNFELDIARIRVAGECIRAGETLVVDANKARKTHEALRILRLTEDGDFQIEQPYLTYAECLSIRRQVRQPMILDKCMTDIIAEHVAAAPLGANRCARRDAGIGTLDAADTVMPSASASTRSACVASVFAMYAACAMVPILRPTRLSSGLWAGHTAMSASRLERLKTSFETTRSSRMWGYARQNSRRPGDNQPKSSVSVVVILSVPDGRKSRPTMRRSTARTSVLNRRTSSETSSAAAVAV